MQIHTNTVIFPWEFIHLGKYSDIYLKRNLLITWGKRRGGVFTGLITRIWQEFKAFVFYYLKNEIN